MKKEKLAGLALAILAGALAACSQSDEGQIDTAAKSSAEPAGQVEKTEAPKNPVIRPATSLENDIDSKDPNPIQVCDRSGLGQTTISWDAPGLSTVEVRIHSPTGKLMASGSSGSTQTGKWVKDGMVFFLVDGSNGEVLDKIKVEHTQTGCP